MNITSVLVARMLLMKDVCDAYFVISFTFIRGNESRWAIYTYVTDTQN